VSEERKECLDCKDLFFILCLWPQRKKRGDSMDHPGMQAANERRHRQWKLEDKVRNIPLSEFTASELSALVRLTCPPRDITSGEMDLIEKALKRINGNKKGGSR